MARRRVGAQAGGDAQGALRARAPGSDRELATVEGRGWGKRPVKITTDDATAIDPGLLLFVVYAVRILAEDVNTGGGAAASTAAMG